MKRPKHLSHFTDEQFKEITTNYNRFAFGFAEPGEVYHGIGFSLEFLGNFARKKDAVVVAEEKGGKVEAYLFGKIKTGWVAMREIVTN